MSPTIAILDKSHIELAKKLIETGEKPYCGFKSFEVTLGITAGQLPRKLVFLAEKCKELELPIISVKVVNKNNQISKLLLNWCRTNYPDYRDATSMQIYKEEAKKINTTDKIQWEKLLEPYVF